MLASELERKSGQRLTIRVDLGARQSAVGMFTAGYSVTTIQQLLKGKNSIVMKRSLYRLINNL